MLECFSADAHRTRGFAVNRIRLNYRQLKGARRVKCVFKVIHTNRKKTVTMPADSVDRFSRFLNEDNLRRWAADEADTIVGRMISTGRAHSEKVTFEV